MNAHLYWEGKKPKEREVEDRELVEGLKGRKNNKEDVVAPLLSQML